MEVDRSVGLNETDIDQWRRKMVANQIIDQPDEASPAASSATAAPVTATPINTEDAYDQLLDPDELDELGEDPDAIEDAAYVNNLEYSGADVLPPIVDTSAAPEAVASPAVVDAADELAAPVIGEPVAQATPVAPDFIPQATPAVAEPVDSVPDQQAEPAAVEPAESAAVEPAGVEPGGDQPAPEGDAAAAQPATNESPAFDWLAEESDSEKASDDDDDLQSFLRNLS